MAELKKLAPKEVRYIKLGKGDCWADRSLEKGEIHLGHKDIPHEICVVGNWDEAVEIRTSNGQKLSKARDAVREIRDFYTLGSDCLWVAFARGYLWWAFAEPEVTWLGVEEDGCGARMRKVIGGWRNTNIRGEELHRNNLSSFLTQVAAYRQTICAVRAQDYLLRRINGIEEPVLVQARETKKAMIAAVSSMITKLHYADFEVMVDLIFARTGWQRVSRVGGTQKDVDLVLQQQATGELAFVQVKSKATQDVLDDYVDRYRSGDVYDRMFFVCHTPGKMLVSDGDKSVHLWTGDMLAETAVRAGLYDWLMEKIG